MGIHELAFAFDEVPALFQRNDDDMYDRMSHRWTAAQLICFALLVTTSTYVGDPIHCWVPVHFHGSWTKYTDNYCWIKNTYYYPMDQEIGQAYRAENMTPIVYYQWVSLILMLQALLFYLPIVFWRKMNNDTGMDMNDIIETAEKVQRMTDPEGRSKLLTFLAKQTHRYLGIPKLESQHNSLKATLHKICGLCGKKYGNYVTVLYFIIKLVFLANVIGQLWMMNFFLGQNYSNYGIEVATAMYYGMDWTQSSRFPRVTFCDVSVRRLGNVQDYTVQCVLTINLFNEKIYLYLWWWFVLVAAMTAFGLLLHAIRTLKTTDREAYITKHLRLGLDDFDADSTRNLETLRQFIYDYLRYDGVLLMRLVGHNTNKATVRDLICALYKHYVELPSTMKALEDKLPPEDVALVPTSSSSDTSFG